MVSSFQYNNALLHEFNAFDPSPTGPLQDMARAIEKRRELVASTAKLKDRDSAIRRDLRALFARADKWLRDASV